MKKKQRINPKCLTRKCEQCKNYIDCFNYRGNENERKKKKKEIF